jgi:serine phosphatase RsbU (regulator of sigma subunit)
VRTSELDRALAELWGEMALARKIQSALVPVAPVLAKCETAALMKPTSQVGGDYYDVVHAGDGEWILIGDVSGHGVSAGLVMMMCHTAVRTVLRSDPSVGPARLLSIVNRVLTQTIAQLGEEKYMTMSAFRRSPDGVVRFAGAHQDVHVYRAATKNVEAIETRGMWLGIKADIDCDLQEGELELEPGDVLLLHTDGITEAMDDAGAVFDDQRLVKVLESSGERTAEEILEAIFRALDGWHVTDDATVIVVKQG